MPTPWMATAGAGAVERITAENIGRAQKQPVSRDSSGVCASSMTERSRETTPLGGGYHEACQTRACPGCKEDVLGTQAVPARHRDKAPAQFVDIDPRMLAGGGISGGWKREGEVVISGWNGPIQIRWWNADGTAMRVDANPPQITVYAP